MVKCLHRKRRKEAVEAITAGPACAAPLCMTAGARISPTSNAGMLSARTLDPGDNLHSRVQQLPLGALAESPARRGQPRIQSQPDQGLECSRLYGPARALAHHPDLGAARNYPRSRPAPRADADASQNPMPATCSSGQPSTKTPCCVARTIQKRVSPNDAGECRLRMSIVKLKVSG